MRTGSPVSRAWGADDERGWGRGRSPRRRTGEEDSPEAGRADEHGPVVVVHRGGGRSSSRRRGGGGGEGEEEQGRQQQRREEGERARVPRGAGASGAGRHGRRRRGVCKLLLD